MAELKDGKNFCECTGCGEMFNSVFAFDKHQVWTKPDPKGNQDVRCLTVKEMEARGFLKNEGGYWITGRRPRALNTEPKNAA